MNIIKILLIKEFLIIKENMLKYLLILNLTPLVLYLFLTIPLSVIIVDMKPIYMVWSAPGIWIVSTLFTVYLMSFYFYNRNFDSGMMQSSPVQSYQYFIASLIYSLIIGTIQLLLCIIIVSSLNVDYISFLNLVSVFLIILPVIFIVSSLSCIVNFLIKIPQFLIFTHIGFFLLVSFGLGSFIPIERFPIDYASIIKFFPLTGSIINCQNIISTGFVFFNLIFLSYLYAILFGVINILLIDKSVEGQKS